MADVLEVLDVAEETKEFRKPNISNHVLQRYCERVMGMKDSTEIKRYIQANRDILSNHLWKMFNHSRFVWNGQIGDNVTRNFYLADNYILVTDTTDKTLITIYKVDYGFPDSTNRLVAHDLLDTIEKLREKHQKEAADVDERTNILKVTLENLNKEISSLEAKIEVLKNRRKMIQEEINQIGSELQLIYKEMQKYANQLCNSVELKRDLVDLEIGRRD